MSERRESTQAAARHVTGTDARKMTDNMWSSFERDTGGRMADLVAAVPGARNTVNRYGFAFRHVVLNIHSALLSASYIGDSKLSVVASEVESAFYTETHKFDAALESARKNRSLEDLDGIGYAALKGVATAYLELQATATAEITKGIQKTVEPLAVSTYVDRILTEYEQSAVHHA